MKTTGSTANVTVSGDPYLFGPGYPPPARKRRERAAYLYGFLFGLASGAAAMFVILEKPLG